MLFVLSVGFCALPLAAFLFSDRHYNHRGSRAAGYACASRYEDTLLSACRIEPLAKTNITQNHSK
jgi:hypothetical protein